MLNSEQRATAVYWYAHKGFSLQTIADHYGLTVDQLAREIRTV